MVSASSLNCEKLRAAFEGREAIYIEKGVLRVCVTNICCRRDRIDARVEEVPTKGLGRSLFHLRQSHAPRPLRWEISAGYLTTVSEHEWHMGYGGWSLHFSPEVVSGLVDAASEWPDELDAVERYYKALSYLNDRHVTATEWRVFPD